MESFPDVRLLFMFVWCFFGLFCHGDEVSYCALVFI